MNKGDAYKIVADLGLAQRRAGVQKEVSDLVIAYARLETDAGRIPVFHQNPKPSPAPTHPAVAQFLKLTGPFDDRFVDFLNRYARRLKGKNVPPLFTVEHLAQVWGFTPAAIRYFARHPENEYKRFTVPKKSGGQREILAPKYKLKIMQRWISQHILKANRPHPASTAFYPGDSIVRNAEQHIGKATVIRIDLKDFFPSIPFKRVRKVFQSLGYPYQVAQVLANLCCYQGALPQGAPSSPHLANLICRNLDERMTALSVRMHFSYTRYADDLIISSDHPNVAGLIPFLLEIVRSESFVVNEKKIKVMRQNKRQEVTGIVVNEHLNLPRDYCRKLRAAAHRQQTKTKPVVLKGSSFRQVNMESRLQGNLAFLQMVNPKKAQSIQASHGNKA